jgi:hypothetical protein
MAKIRGVKGFIQIGEEKRQVRSLRATHTTWQAITQAAAVLEISPADLIEQLAQKIELLEEQPEARLGGKTTLKSKRSEIHLQDNSEDLRKAIALLKEALTLKPNAGGAIKAKIREALELLQLSAPSQQKI